MVAIVGQNGSGKTTLAKHFNGLLMPTGGEILVNGKTTKEQGVFKLGQKVGYVFQNPDHQIFSETVLDEVAFSPRLRGLPEAEVKPRVTEALAAVGLAGTEQEDPFSLTKSGRQRVAVASVLAAKPDVLILDEPTTGPGLRRAAQHDGDGATPQRERQHHHLCHPSHVGGGGICAEGLCDEGWQGAPGGHHPRGLLARATSCGCILCARRTLSSSGTAWAAPSCSPAEMVECIEGATGIMDAEILPRLQLIVSTGWIRAPRSSAFLLTFVGALMFRNPVWMLPVALVLRQMLWARSARNLLRIRYILIVLTISSLVLWNLFSNGVTPLFWILEVESFSFRHRPHHADDPDDLDRA